MSFGDVAGPDTGGQTVFGLVGARDQLLRLVERLSDHDRSEDFLTNNAHGRLDVLDDGWLDKVTAIAGARAASYITCAGLLALVHIVSDSTKLFLGNQRTHLCVRAQSWTQFDLLRMLSHAFDDFVENIALYHETGTGAA